MLAVTPPRIAASGLGRFPDRPEREWHQRRRLVRHLARGCETGRCDAERVRAAAGSGDDATLRGEAKTLTGQLLEPFSVLPAVAGSPQGVLDHMNRGERGRWLREAVRLGLLDAGEVLGAIKAGDEQVGQLVRESAQRLDTSLRDVLTRLGPEEGELAAPPPRLRPERMEYYGSGGDAWAIDLQEIPCVVSVGSALDHSPQLAHAVSAAFCALSLHVAPVFGPEDMREFEIFGLARDEAQVALSEALSDLGVSSADEVERETLVENIENEYGVPFSAVEAILDGRQRDGVEPVTLDNDPTRDAAYLRRCAAPFIGTQWGDWVRRVAHVIETVGGRSLPNFFDLNFWLPTARIVHFDRDADEIEFLEHIGQEIEPAVLDAPTLEGLRSIVLGVTWAVTLIDEAAAIDASADDAPGLAAAA